MELAAAAPATLPEEEEEVMPVLMEATAPAGLPTVLDTAASKEVTATSSSLMEEDWVATMAGGSARMEDHKERDSGEMDGTATGPMEAPSTTGKSLEDS